MNKSLRLYLFVSLGLLSWSIILNPARGWEEKKPIFLKYYYLSFSDLKKEDGEKETVINYTQIMAGPFVDLTLVNNLVLRLECGYAFNREFEFRDDDTSQKLWGGDLKDNGYVAVSLALQY